jgi:uroporphyrinogen-III synthase
VRILPTRPEADAQRSAAALRALGHEPIIAPLLRIEAVADAPIGPGPWLGILTTSANAALAVVTHARFDELRTVPVYAAGNRSADAMRAAGFANVTSADGNVGDLVQFVATQTKPGAALLYLAAGERAGDLAGDLRSRGYIVHTTIVYRAIAAGEFPRAAADALTHGIGGVLHFSRRSAEAYIEAARAAGLLASALKPTHYCLSAQVAELLAQAGAAAVHVAPRPAEAALIELIGPA